MNWRNIKKFITAFFGALVAWVTLVVMSDPEAITSEEWLQGLILLGMAGGVYQVRNDP